MLKPVDTQRVGFIVDDLKKLKSSSREKPVIMVTAFNLGHNYLKTLYWLKRSGSVVVLVLAEDMMCNTVDFSCLDPKVFYDRLYVLNPYTLEMPLISERVPVDIIHALVGNKPPFVFAELVTRAASPVVVEYFDFRQIMYDEQDMASHFGIHDMGAEYDQWQTVFTRASGVIHMDSPEIIETLSEKYSHRPECLYFNTYVCPEFHTGRRNETVSNALPQKIVFAGGLHGGVQSHSFSQHKTIRDVAEILTGQGFRFQIVNASDKGGGGFDYYSDLSFKFQGFSYRSAVSGHSLSTYLAGHDLGWNVLGFEHGEETPFYYKTLMSSKLFDYLQAGLPVVVSKTTEFVADFVKENGIGLVLGFDELHMFSDRVRETDWADVRWHVRKASTVYSMENQMPRLISFYKKLSGNVMKQLYD